jgi:RNA polymerase sigma-70 factor, ECF subfamily
MGFDEHGMVERVRRGDNAAAVELIDLHYERIYAFLRRLAGTDADAADLTQRVFTRVWQSLPNYAGRSSLGSWLHGIAYHIYVDWVRGNHRVESRPDEWWDRRVSPQLSPADIAMHNDLREKVYASVDKLAPEVRDTIHLHYYLGLTLGETATAMGVAASTVKYRLRQGVSELEQKLNSAAPLPNSQTQFTRI